MSVQNEVAFFDISDKWAILLFPRIDREALCKIHLKTEAFDLAHGKKTWQLEKNSKITACCSLWYGKNTNGRKILFIKSAYCKDWRYFLVHESTPSLFMSIIFRHIWPKIGLWCDNDKFWNMKHLRHSNRADIWTIPQKIIFFLLVGYVISWDLSNDHVEGEGSIWPRGSSGMDTPIWPPPPPSSSASSFGWVP